MTNRTRICPTCDGDDTCRDCWNQGTIVHPNPPKGQEGDIIQCPTCKGQKRCVHCTGGRVPA